MDQPINYLNPNFLKGKKKGRSFTKELPRVKTPARGKEKIKRGRKILETRVWCRAQTKERIVRDCHRTDAFAGRTRA